MSNAWLRYSYNYFRVKISITVKDILCFVLTLIRFWEIVLEPTFILLSYLNVFKFIYEIYICGIFYGVFIESAFKRLESPHHIAAWWGRSQEDEAFSPSPSMLTPYSLRHASTIIWRGCEVEEREEVDLTRSTPPQPFLTILYPPLSFYHLRRPNANPHMLQLISDEGNRFWTTLTGASGSWPLLFSPSLAADWYVSHVNSPSQ